MNRVINAGVSFLMRAIIVFLLSGFCPIFAEIVTLTASNRSQSSAGPSRSATTITLAAGDVATSKYLSANAFLDVLVGSTTIRVGTTASDAAKPPVIAGPATIQLLNFEIYNAALATIEIKRAGTVQPSTPHNVVVIPNDASGNHQVYLESSSDMVTWTAVQPGTFSSSASNRFFRVRITK